MHDYAGGDSFPTTVPLIDDSDAPTASNFNAAPQALADRTTSLEHHKLTKDAPDTITGAVTVASGASIEFASGALEKIDAGATLEIAGTLQHDVGSTEQGTISGGTVNRTGGLIEISGDAQIALECEGAIGIGVAGAIECGVAGGITGNAAGAIASTVAGSIRSTVEGGLDLAGGANDWPTCTPMRSKTYTFGCKPCDPSAIASPGTGNWNFVFAILTGRATTTNLCLWLDNPHEGATLDTVTVMFAVGQAHTGVPATLPSLFVVRQPLPLGAPVPTPENLSTVAQQFPPGVPATGAAWYDSGNTQTLTYHCDQNNVIDNANYVYYLVLFDEHGVGALPGNQFVSVTCTYTNIADMRFSS